MTAVERGQILPGGHRPPLQESQGGWGQPPYLFFFENGLALRELGAAPSAVISLSKLVR
jgi:hypothetical protein